MGHQYSGVIHYDSAPGVNALNNWTPFKGIEREREESKRVLARTQEENKIMMKMLE